MDLLLGFFCIIIALISTGVIYFVLVPSLKEKSYDEAKAEQKKKVEEYLAQGRSAKEKAKDKKLKKAGKKVKEKISSESLEVSSEEAEPTKAHVAFMDPPVVDEERPVLIEEKKKKKNKKEKPILINKNEHTPVIDIPPPVINHFEQIVPKDDFSLKRSISREEIEPTAMEAAPPPKNASKPKPQSTNSSKESKPEKSQPQKPAQPAQKASEKTSTKSMEKAPVKPLPQPKAAEEVVGKSTARPVQSAPESLSPSTKNSRKKRSELATLHQMSGEKEAVNMTLLMPLVHKAELSRTEIQVLIDCLLNKQQNSSVDSAEWIEGRQDPVVKLKKQLAEKEKSLQEEQEAGVALQSKLRELRAELNAERHTSRQLEEGLSSRQAELTGLTTRLQLLSEEKQGALQQVQTLQAKLSEEHLVLCKLQEDQGQTQAALQQELLAQRQQLELHIARLTEQHQETVGQLEGQLGQLASQLQEQEALNTQLSGELRDRGSGSQDLARQVKDLHAEIERVMSKSKYESNRLQTEVSSLTEQLTVKRAEVDKLNTLVTSLQADNSRLSHQITSVSREAQQLRDENETLAAQVTASMERPATEGRENGDITYETKIIDNGTNKFQEESIIEKLKEEVLMKDKEISHIKTDLTQQECAVKRLKEDLETTQNKSEKLLKEVSAYKSLVQEHESVISALREECESAHKLVNTLRQDIVKQKAEITQLSRDCEQLDSRGSTIEKLTSELNTHKTRLADQAALIQTLQRELDKFKCSADLSIEVNNYKSQLEQKEALVLALTAQVSRLSQEQTDSQARLTQDYEAKLSSLRHDLDTQRRKNDEAEEKVKLEEQERTKQLLQRILPHVSVDTKQEYETWLEKFMASVNSEDGHGAMLAEVEQQNCQLQAMVTHYKAIIADTEGMLNRLQSHVEQEEGRWGQQIHTLQAQLEAVIQERDRLEAAAKTAGHLTVDAGSGTN